MLAQILNQAGLQWWQLGLILLAASMRPILKAIAAILVGRFLDPDIAKLAIKLMLQSRSRQPKEESSLLKGPRHNFHFFGSFCFSFSTGSKRSAIFLTRSRVLSERNLRRSAFFFFRQLATSSHVTGVETVGSSLARSE